MSTCGYPTNPLQLQGTAQFLLQSPTPALPPCAGAAFPEAIPGAGSWNGVPGNRETEELPDPQAAFNHFLGASSLFPRQAAALPKLAAASNSQKELWKSGETVRDTQGTAKSIPHLSLPKFHQRHKPCFFRPEVARRQSWEGKGRAGIAGSRLERGRGKPEEKPDSRSERPFPPPPCAHSSRERSRAPAGTNEPLGQLLPLPPGSKVRKKTPKTPPNLPRS